MLRRCDTRRSRGSGGKRVLNGRTLLMLLARRPSGDFEAKSSCGRPVGENGRALYYSPSAGALRLLRQWKIYDLGMLLAAFVAQGEAGGWNDTSKPA